MAAAVGALSGPEASTVHCGRPEAMWIGPRGGVASPRPGRLARARTRVRATGSQPPSMPLQPPSMRLQVARIGRVCRSPAATPPREKPLFFPLSAPPRPAARRLREVFDDLHRGDLDAAASRPNDPLARHPARPHLAKEDGRWRLHHHPTDAALVSMWTSICAEAIGPRDRGRVGPSPRHLRGDRLRPRLPRNERHR
jgi:hypothetical protein